MPYTIAVHLFGGDEVAILEKNVNEARDAANLTMDAYKEGKVIVSVPLTALTFLASQEDQLWQWRGEVTTDYIAVYKRSAAAGSRNRCRRQDWARRRSSQRLAGDPAAALESHKPGGKVPHMEDMMMRKILTLAIMAGFLFAGAARAQDKEKAYMMQKLRSLGYM
jgi:hypothetical protein